MTATVSMSPRVKYREEVQRAIRSGYFIKLNEFGNPNSAYTIAWMVEKGKGLLAFEEYPPGTFQAVVRHDTEVWFRRV